MEISFSAEELHATVGLNAAIEEALDAEDNPAVFEACLLIGVAGWVVELRQAKGDVDADLRGPELQEHVSLEPLALRSRGARGQELRDALIAAVVAAVTC